jgi:hypothetical protein
MFIEKVRLYELQQLSHTAVSFKIYPTLGGTDGVKELKKLKHPVIESFKKFTKASKLVSLFEESV